MNFNYIEKIEQLLSTDTIPSEVKQLFIPDRKMDFKDYIYYFFREFSLKEYTKSKFQNNQYRALDFYDPNKLIDILPNVKLKDNYILDYVYVYNESGGHPKLYIRKIEDEPFKKIKEYNKWQENNSLLEYIEVDKTEDSFLQVAVLQELGETFFLYWHSNYGSKNIIIDKSKISFWFDKESKQIIEKSDYTPKVKIENNEIEVVYFIFKRFGGGILKVTRNYSVNDKILVLLKHNEECEMEYISNTLF